MWQLAAGRKERPSLTGSEPARERWRPTRDLEETCTDRGQVGSGRKILDMKVQHGVSKKKTSLGQDSSGLRRREKREPLGSGEKSHKPGQGLKPGIKHTEMDMFVQLV